MQALAYENFLRWGFGLPQSFRLDRGGDPAKTADADAFTEENIECVKASTAYAMQIYWQDIDANSRPPQPDHDELKNSIIDVINATTLDEISNLISEFEESFVEKYYYRGNGRITFRETSS